MLTWALKYRYAVPSAFRKDGAATGFPQVPSGGADFIMIAVLKVAPVDGVMVSGVVLDVVLPLRTATMAIPTEVTSEAGTEAVNCEELSITVCSGLPFQVTFEPEPKPDPKTSSVKSAAPAMTRSGLMAEIWGDAVAAIWNVTGLELTPRLETVTVAVPAVPTRLAGTTA